MSEVKVVRDEQGNAIVIIPDIIFWNKQDIDWDAVKECNLTEYMTKRTF